MSEDLNPIAPAGQSVESVEQEEIIDYSNKGLKEIIDIFQNLLETADNQQQYKHAEALKAAFYKTLRKEKIAAGLEQPEEGAPSPFDEVERGFKELYGKYKERRSEYLREQDIHKEENLKEKLSIIEDLKALLDKQEDISQTFPLFREIQNRWRAVGPVAQNKVKDLYDTYQHYVEMFYDYLKINREMRDLDFRKNMEIKEELCRQAEALAEMENVVEAFRELQKLHEQWKEIGPVDAANRESIWERFKAATSVINKKHQEYFEGQKVKEKENLEAKSLLCEKVEVIAATEVKDSNMWNDLSKQIEDIQKEWKSIGFATRKENQKIYDRFRAACDDFFARKREFYAEFKDKMQENVAKKMALIEKAEALKDSDDWKATSDALIELQRQWKEIGPVTRKKSEQIWKRFRAACDEFYNRRDAQRGASSSDQAENLEKKKALIAEINEFVVEGSDAARAAFKEFRERWNSIGFVPLKEKENIQNEFRNALNEKFAQFREGAGRLAYKAERAVKSERDRLVQKYLKKEQDIATWENNIGFFAKSKNAEALLKNLRKEIDRAKKDLAELEAQIKEFDKQEQDGQQQR